MKKRYLSVLLLIILFVNLFSGIMVDAASSVTTIVACSDFQNNSGYDSGKQVVDSILDTIKNNGVSTVDGFFCCGDYDTGYSNTKKGIDTLKSSIDGFVKGDSVFVQGNHDTAIGTNGLSLSGINDPSSGAYGVFVINEDDYMWHNDNEQRIKQTAQNLIEYLNEKLEENYKKPIFVLSHLPLNYNMRTYNDGDGKYAKYIFDALNTAGEKGLNIVFMFGHDHSNGWDDYLGGSSIYLKKGDSINIANYSKTEFNTYTLNFTYMNAGYIGYYNNENGADDTLTMTVIKISDDDFTVERYSSSGKHLLKSVGVTNSFKKETAYPPNLTQYTSPQRVLLSEVSDNTPIENLIKQRTAGAKYQRITDVSQIKSDAKYLLLYKGESDYVMKPVVVTKANSSGSERTGYDIESTDDFTNDSPISDFSDYLWMFTPKSDGKWFVGCEQGDILFTNTSTQSVVASFSENGSPLTIEKADDKFTFFSGKYYLNYNSRGLINGYSSTPAEFFIYEYVGNTVTVKGGTTSKGSAFAGESVTVSFADENKCFDSWTVTPAVDFDLSQKTITFVMPDYPIEFKAEYSGNHAWSEYIYNNDATRDEDGTETRTCANCDQTETRFAEGTRLGSSSLTATIVACSDFQNNSGYDSGKQVVDSILDTIKNNGVSTVDGFFCCGDYDTGYSNTKKGIDTLKSSIDGFVKGDSVFVQGNHDTAIGTNGLSLSGNNDPSSGAYGVFVINEDDYMWHNDNEQRIKQTAQNLIEYLNEKLEENYKKPIFVLSHLPLNYNMRTYNDGDGKYAKYIFDALNTAGEKGLNIVFMFGHDHSNGWDDYLGGSSIYLKKGDSINIANYSKTEFNTYTLNFTYMNAGYIGYYNNENGADDTLTMTVIKVYEDDFTIARYSSDGKHLLKSAGVTNSYKNESGYSPDTIKYTSPQTVLLTNVTDSTPIPDLIKQRTVGAKYKLITDISQIKSDSKYLFIYKGTSDYVMKPVVVTKTNSSNSARTGYDIEGTSDFTKSTCISDFADYLWTITKVDNGWYIGANGNNMQFSRTNSESASGLLSSTGDLLSIEENSDRFTVSNGSYYLNYNSRGLINAFYENPAEFFIYEFVGNTISVVDGSASKDCALPGETVTISLNDTNKCFDTWTTSSNIDFDLDQKELIFEMPDYPLEFVPQYNELHAWSEYVYNDDATTEADGTKTATCENCGVTDTVIAEDTKLPEVEVDPTYRPDHHMPFLTLNESGNGVVLDQNKSWATRVYWGNIGDEYFEYKWFDEDLRLPADTDYFADYAPQDGEMYNFTKPGWYRFIVKAIRTGTTAEDYTYSEILFDFYYDGKNAPTVPTITKLENNQVQINYNGAPVKKFYYGNIGQKNTPYSWFNDFWGTALATRTYTPVFDTRDNRVITLQSAGYYNIVIVLTDGTEYVYTAYAKENAPVIKKTEGGAIVDIDCLAGNIGANATLTRIYYGYVGTEDKDLTTYDEIKANTTGFTGDSSAVQGKTYTLKNEGYYKFLVLATLSNGKAVELTYTVCNS